MPTLVHPYDIGCELSPSAPAETLLQDGWKTYLLFFAVSKTVGQSSYLQDLGVAILDCQDCHISQFGYPNDEGLPEHPLYCCGIAEARTSVLEVTESTWADDVSNQMLASARRIWSGRGTNWQWARDRKLRHFMITLKEATFECLASALVIERFCSTFQEAFDHVIGKLNEH
jgi:hypothetical protein